VAAPAAAAVGVASLESPPSGVSPRSVVVCRRRTVVVFSPLSETATAVEAAGIIPVVVAVVVSAAAAGSRPAADADTAIGALAAVQAAAGVPNLVEGFLSLGGVAISGTGAGSVSGSGLRVRTGCCPLSLSAGGIGLGSPLDYLDGVAG
jgi:hypothetical protein